MQDLAENKQLSAVTSTELTGSFVNDSTAVNLLSHFCRVQLHQIAAQFPIVWAQIVYYDPFLNTHQEVVGCEGALDPNTRNELRSKLALTDFPSVLTLKELSLASSTWKVYLCPIGYRNYQSEHLLIVSKQSLSPALKNYVVSCTELISNHCELYSNLYYKSAETSLLEQLIHRVGHQLRNPLSLISLYAENLRLESSSSYQTQATIIRDTVEDLLANLNDLIYCSKSSQLRIALHDVHLLMAETLQELQPWIQEKQLKVSYSPESVILMVDRVQIRQVLTNLLSNAIHFSPHSGTIYVNWQVFQSEVLIQIIDQGSGLSDSDLKKVFTPFYSKRPGGTGLGLAIAKKIVLDHQGNLWAQNSPEGGAQFSFTLPRQ